MLPVQLGPPQLATNSRLRSIAPITPQPIGVSPTVPTQLPPQPIVPIKPLPPEPGPPQLAGDEPPTQSFPPITGFPPPVHPPVPAPINGVTPNPSRNPGGLPDPTPDTPLTPQDRQQLTEFLNSREPHERHLPMWVHPQVASHLMKQFGDMRAVIPHPGVTIPTLQAGRGTQMMSASSVGLQNASLPVGGGGDEGNPGVIPINTGGGSGGSNLPPPDLPPIGNEGNIPPYVAPPHGEPTVEIPTGPHDEPPSPIQIPEEGGQDAIQPVNAPPVTVDAQGGYSYAGIPGVYATPAAAAQAWQQFSNISSTANWAGGIAGLHQPGGGRGILQGVGAPGASVGTGVTGVWSPWGANQGYADDSGAGMRGNFRNRTLEQAIAYYRRNPASAQTGIRPAFDPGARGIGGNLPGTNARAPSAR